MSQTQHPLPEEPVSVLAPIWQLFMILVPTVANSFLLVYVLLGLVLEGEQKLGWDAEAAVASAYVALGVLVFCALMLGLLYLTGRSLRHPLAIVNWVQCALALLFLAAIQVVRAF